MSRVERDTGNLRFVNIRLLGEGASARVSEAHDRWSSREVVLKEARNTGQTGHGFLKEARLLQHLRSPVFPELHEYDPGTAQRPPLMVLERRPGKALGDTAILPVEDAVWIAVQVLQGLAELEEHGWIHGDLGPANLLLEGSRASLIDLGLARSSQDREARRSGTLQVMPPEILMDGLPHPRSDMFSLGALLFQIIHGVRPFPDDPEEAIQAILGGRHRPIDPDVKQPLRSLLERMLRQDPLKRPTAAEALRFLLPTLDARHAGLLAPRREPGEWEPLQLDRALETLLGEGRVELRSGRAGLWAARLAQLRLESAEVLGPMLTIRRNPGETLLDWLACRLDGSDRLKRYPELAQAVERRKGGAETLRLMLGFLDDQLDRPLQGVCWVSGVDDPEIGLLDELRAICARQHRPLILLQMEGDDRCATDPGVIRLEPASAEVWADWWRCLAPGLELDETAAKALDPLVAGDPARMPQLLARMIACGHLVRGESCWSLGPSGLPSEVGWTTADLETLTPTQREALHVAGAWLEPSAPGLWRNWVAQGRTRDLEALESAGWLRDRGDGQLDLAAGVVDQLDADRVGSAHRDFLLALWEQAAPPHELCLLHLSRAGLGSVTPTMALDVLTKAKGLIDPRRKLHLIRDLLPQLPPENQTDLKAILANTLLEQGELSEARRLLHQLLRQPVTEPGRPGAVDRRGSLFMNLLYVYDQLRRPRLALRVLDLAMDDPSLDVDRAVLETQSLRFLIQAGRREEATGLVDMLAENLANPAARMDATRAHALNTAAICCFQLGRQDQAARLWMLMDKDARRELQVQQRVWLANNLGVLHLQAGRLEQARAELDHAGREAAQYHLDRYELMARVNLAIVQLRRGAPDQAVRELEPALLQAVELHDTDAELAVLDHLGDAWAALGDFDNAEHCWNEELRRARELKRPEDELEPLKHLLCLDVDLGRTPDASLRERLAGLGQGSDVWQQWHLLERVMHGPAPFEDQESAPPRQLAAARLLRLARMRDGDGEDLLQALLEAEPRLDGLRMALAILENRLLWLPTWAPHLRELREGQRLHQIRLLGLEGELAWRREQWTTAGMRLGRATRLLTGLAADLSPVWLERVANSPWVIALVARAAECLSRMKELERSDHGQPAGSAGRIAGA